MPHGVVMRSMRLAISMRKGARSLLVFPVFSNVWNGLSLEMFVIVLVSLYPLCRAEENGSGFLFSFLFCLPFDRISTHPITPKLSPVYPHACV